MLAHTHYAFCTLHISVQCTCVCKALETINGRITLIVPLVDTDGFVKVLSDKKTDRMLGVHMIGSVS